MKFTQTALGGAYIIELQELRDKRGFFARAWCEKEFRELGLSSTIVQANFSFNHERGTLRGLHYQKQPFAEVKSIRCTRGAIMDVIVDLRFDSPTYLQWVGARLSAEERQMLYVPEGFAHGYQTLEDDTEVFYQVSEFYMPNAEVGARYDDPAFDIQWPLPVSVISDKDASWAPYQTEQ